MNDQLPDIALDMSYEELCELVSVLESLTRHDEVEKPLRDRAAALLTKTIKVRAEEGK